MTIKTIGDFIQLTPFAGGPDYPIYVDLYNIAQVHNGYAFVTPQGTVEFSPVTPPNPEDPHAYTKVSVLTVVLTESYIDSRIVTETALEIVETLAAAKARPSALTDAE